MQNRFDIGHGPMDRLEQSIEAIDALNWMLYHTLENGDGMKHLANGIHAIFTTQCRELDETKQLLVGKFDSLESKVAKNLLQSEKINSDKLVSNSSSIDMASVRDVSGDYYRLQQEFVAAMVEAGKTPQEIGAAMMLHPEAIRNMLAAMPDRETREAWDKIDGRPTPNVQLGRAVTVDPAVIDEVAKASNVKPATVERVIALLQSRDQAGSGESPLSAAG